MNKEEISMYCKTIGAYCFALFVVICFVHYLMNIDIGATDCTVNYNTFLVGPLIWLPIVLVFASMIFMLIGVFTQSDKNKEKE
jgi:hypothetical protein